MGKERMMNKNTQKGGNQSTNIQAEQMVVNVGIDEKRAREVFEEMNLQLRQDYTREALDIANVRVAEFEKVSCLKWTKSMVHWKHSQILAFNCY